MNWLADWFSRWLLPAPKADDPALVDAGARAVAEAERLWAMDIIDPPRGSKNPRAAESLVVVNENIHANGWGANVNYHGQGAPAWWGMYAG